MAKNPKLIAVTSGKGGTGKSSICYGIGYTLAKQGNRTLIIELDFGLRCLDLMFGMTGRVQYDLGDVLQGKVEIQKAASTVPSASNLEILCAPKDAFMKVTAEEVVDICRKIRKYYDYIIIDTGAGISSHVFDIVTQANMILIVTTPDPICIRDATMMSDEFYKRGNKGQRLIVNKLSKKDLQTGMIGNLDEIIDAVGIQLLGVIPEDFALKEATGKGLPLSPSAPSLAAFDAISKRLMGDQVPLTIK
ncbi:MAG: AAA family ATPase [Oscillospiraceae bacterium]|jgi:septum site-determining protein MinD|nr:AAA family ATPase [Oscillospiraceae bacterium]